MLCHNFCFSSALKLGTQKINFRHIIPCYLKESKNSNQNVYKIYFAYEQSNILNDDFRKWFEKLKPGNFYLKDYFRCGQPSSPVKEDMLKEAIK